MLVSSLRFLPLVLATTVVSIAGGCASVVDEDADVAESALSGRDVLDPRFGDRGLARGEELGKDATSAMAFDDRDRLLVAWSRFDDDGRLRVTRYRADGSRDTAFGAGNKIPLLLPPEGAQLAVEPLWDGSAIVAATALCALSTCPFDLDRPGRTTNFLFKLDAAGNVDRAFPVLTFGAGTRSLKLARARDNEVVLSVDRDDGRVELAWISGSGVVLKRHELRGVPGNTMALAANETRAYIGRAGTKRSGRDRWFGLVAGVARDTGARTVDAGPWNAEEPRGPMVTTVLATKTNVFVAGYAHEDGFGTANVFVKKLGVDLVPDGRFGRAGTKVFDAGSGGGGRLSDLRVLANGSVLAAGTIEADGIWRNESSLPGSDDDLGLVLLKRDGAYDESFGKRGTQLVHAGSADDRLLTFSTRSNAIFAAGLSGRTTVIAKLLPR